MLKHDLIKIYIDSMLSPETHAQLENGKFNNIAKFSNMIMAVLCGVSGIERSFLFKRTRTISPKMNKKIYICVNLKVPSTVCTHTLLHSFLFFAISRLLRSFLLNSSMSSSKIEPYWRRHIIIIYCTFALSFGRIKRKRRMKWIQKREREENCLCNVIRIWFYSFSFLFVRRCETHDIGFFQIKKCKHKRAFGSFEILPPKKQKRKSKESNHLPGFITHKRHFIRLFYSLVTDEEIRFYEKWIWFNTIFIVITIKQMKDSANLFMIYSDNSFL